MPTSIDYSSQEFILIRHGATDMSGTLCGKSDPPLNEIGREQTRFLTQLCHSWRIDRVYASDLQRARQTAQPIADALRVPIIIRSDLREISFGSWEGKRWSKIREAQPDLTSIESSLEFCADGGESLACFRERVVRSFRQIAAECNGLPVAVVTHLGVIHTALNEFDPKHSCDNSLSRVDHCSVYRIRTANVHRQTGSGRM